MIYVHYIGWVISSYINNILCILLNLSCRVYHMTFQIPLCFFFIISHESSFYESWLHFCIFTLYLIFKYWWFKPLNIFFRFLESIFSFIVFILYKKTCKKFKFDILLSSWSLFFFYTLIFSSSLFFFFLPLTLWTHIRCCHSNHFV